MTEQTITRAPTGLQRKLVESLQALVSTVPPSKERRAVNPQARARQLTMQASTKAAIVSGSLAMPPGPLGMLTVLPDLFAIWRIQRQLVADIAAASGQTATLAPETMLYCLFRHAAGQALRDLVVRAGERYLVRRATLRVMQRVLRRVGVTVSERAAGRTVSRWLPVVGAVGIGGYAFYDTRQVGRTAAEFFHGTPELTD
jgi:hypothetical protein